jgi:uncharacterized membrane-anchored protein
MIRFVIIWVMVSVLVYGFVYMTTKRQKWSIAKNGKQITISMLISLVVAVSLFFVNQFSGV